MQREIFINKDLRRVSKTYLKMSEMLNEMGINLKKQLINLDWEVNKKKEIDNAINNIIKKIKNLERLNVDIYDYINFAVDEFTKVDEQSASKLEVSDTTLNKKVLGNTQKNESTGKYQIGAPKEPEIKFDNDFKYNPSSKITWKDRESWVKWGLKLEAAKKLRPDLEDGTKTYDHYRDGKGTDLTINYEKAYVDDPVIKQYVDNEIKSAQEGAEKLYKQTNKTSFDLTGNVVKVPNGATENWQKAIGAHHLWSSGEVSVDKDGNYTMTITLHELDKYNFNKDFSDIATGAPDNENGKFEELGWAKGFITRGEIKRTITWKAGQIDTTTSMGSIPNIKKTPPRKA